MRDLSPIRIFLETSGKIHQPYQHLMKFTQHKTPLDAFLKVTTAHKNFKNDYIQITLHSV